MTTDTALTEHDEIEMLLPWYVTGRLDASDRAKVEAALSSDPSLRRQLDLISDEQAGNIAINEAIRAPSTLSVERGMQAVAAQTSLGARQTATGILNRVRAFFAMPTARGVRYAAVAAAALFMLQAVVIGSLMSNRDGYVTASGGTDAKGSTAIVKFADTASAASIAATLDRLGMTIIDGPKPGGTFVVRVGVAGLTKAQRDDRISQLRAASGVVGLVLP